MNKNKYIQEAADDILEILDGMSFDEISAVEDVIEDVLYTAHNDGDEHFNFAAYVMAHERGRYFGDIND